MKLLSLTGEGNFYLDWIISNIIHGFGDIIYETTSIILVTLL